MKIRTEIKTILPIFKAINDFSNEVTLNVTESGIKIILMDSANVAMIHTTLNTSMFIQYDLVSEDIKQISFNLNDFVNIIKQFKKSYLDLEVINNDLVITVTNGTKQTFNLKLIDLSDMKEQKIPELVFNNKVLINNVKNFIEAIKPSYKLFETMQFILKDNDFMINCKSDITNNDIKFSNGDISTLKSDNGICKYSIEYLKKIFRNDLGLKTIIQFNTDYPLLVKYDYLGININFILAPRITNDD